jgi:hypothetical protein
VIEIPHLIIIITIDFSSSTQITMTLPSPDLKIPSSTSTVSVRIIDTTSHLSIPLAPYVFPAIKGFTELSFPSFSFLIEHPSGRKLLYDLGIRKDFEKLPPAISSYVKDLKVTVKKDVKEILEGGVEGKDIEAVIWSDWHWDHTGDMSLFDSSTALIVGPGFSGLLPGYPEDSKGVISSSDYHDRELRELSFSSPSEVKIGNFSAIISRTAVFISSMPLAMLWAISALWLVSRVLLIVLSSWVVMSVISVASSGRVRTSRSLIQFSRIRSI